jgi:hypothetical protein
VVCRFRIEVQGGVRASSGKYLAGSGNGWPPTSQLRDCESMS